MALSIETLRPVAGRSPSERGGDSLLIRGAQAILTGMPGASARSDARDIRVRDGRIHAIGTLAPEPAERVLDASDCVVYPAWINTHHHLFQSLLKGDPLGINVTLMPWLTAIPFRYRPAFDESRFRTAARIGLVELALSGCATVADHNYLYAPGLGFDTSDILFEEADRLGLRFVLCRGGQTRVRQVEDSLPASLRPERFENYLADVERLASRYHDPAPDARRKVVLAPTNPLHGVDAGQLRESAAFARGLGLRMHTHLSETVSYQDDAQRIAGKSAVQYCADNGWVGGDVSFAHLVKLDPEEIALLGATGTGVAHCAQCNARLGSGIAPVEALEAAGAKISIGVDGAASNEAADMYSEVHTAWLMQRAKEGEWTRARMHGGEGEAGRNRTTVEDVVRWATSGGADVLGLTDLGRIEVGRVADLALHAVDAPRHFGLHDLGIAPVASGGGRVKALLVGGKRIVEDGVLAGLDIDALRHEAREAVAWMREHATPL